MDVLRHRDTDVLRFEWLEPEGVRIHAANDNARVQRLVGFRFSRHAHYNLPLDRLRRIEDFLQRRIAEIEEYGKSSTCSVQITREDCTLKNTDSATLAQQIKTTLQVDPFITKRELADLLRVSPRTVASRLKNMRASGEITRIGSTKTGHWKVIKPHEYD